ncbi:hypothetical protein M011DRAFT_463343 [Sporormia fimetaria CBS 119925]|uniref:Integral membrane protein n=1 Tax=Sporormia fimetaria CBS 119925 TaxID=1340428 RepID=A0A6A6VPQ1_9PLEO|nr:hypothetical protein M011DRAFT_463343 [Sporormia fimetaria CBS 119925]
MDGFKRKLGSARNRAAERMSRGTGSASLAEHHSSLPPDDNASVMVVNEGQLPAARDFAALPGEETVQPKIEPPTSLQSSIDAGKPVPKPRNRSSSNPNRPPQSGSAPTGRDRSNSAGQQRPGAGYRQPSIGMRRGNVVPQRQPASFNGAGEPIQRSTSRLPVLDETCVLAQQPTEGGASVPSSLHTSPSQEDKKKMGPLQRVRSAVQAKFGKGGAENTNHGTAPVYGKEYSASMVDVLDTLDAEVQTLTSLTNVQNSLFIPNLGRFVNRNPTYVIRQSPSEAQSLEDINAVVQPAREQLAQEQQQGPRLARNQSASTLATVATIDSTLSDSRYAVLPSGASLEGWSKEDKAELNDHVRHMLHSRRSKLKRAMRGFGQYVRRPLGFLVTLYATLITLFGLAWVLFLIGWINVGGKQIYVVHVIDSVLVALFAIVGDGLAPFRAVDTYHMIYIAHYHHYTWSRRKKDRLPKLHDNNDLPATNAPMTGFATTDDPEKQWEFTVLTPKQQEKLEHHQAKFCKSHSFYKPHETETHYAFPLNFLIAIVILLDCHSMLQIALGACTWGIDYKVRPFALTTVILCFSITCNATAGLLIMLGDRKTRKKDVLERMNRQELTEEAMHKVEKKREKGAESEGDEPAKKKASMDIGRKSLDVFRRPVKSEDSSSGPSTRGLVQGEKSAYP